MITNKTITLYHYNGDEWEISYVGAASVFERTKAEQASRVQNSYKGFINGYPAVVRIPVSSDISVNPGDRVVKGVCKDKTPTKDDVLYVKIVTDNRRGSKYMQHWRLDCE